MHGGLNLSELRALGLRPDEVLDFSASINPLGASPLVRQALQRVDLAAYPDPDCRDLREALSQQLGLELDDILIGNGATELIHLVARSVLRQGDAAAILAPTFEEFEAACRRPRTSCWYAWAMPRRSACGCSGSIACVCETAPRSGCRSTCASASGAWMTAGGWPARYGR